MDGNRHRSAEVSLRNIAKRFIARRGNIIGQSIKPKEKLEPVVWIKPVERMKSVVRIKPVSKLKCSIGQSIKPKEKSEPVVQIKPVVRMKPVVRARPVSKYKCIKPIGARVPIRRSPLDDWNPSGNINDCCPERIRVLLKYLPDCLTMKDLVERLPVVRQWSLSQRQHWFEKHKNFWQVGKHSGRHSEPLAFTMSATLEFWRSRLLSSK